MDGQDTPECSHVIETDFINSQVDLSSEKGSTDSKWNIQNSLVVSDHSPASGNIIQSVDTTSTTSRFDGTELSENHNYIPLSSIVGKSSYPNRVIMVQPRMSSNRQSPMSLNAMCQPQTLLIQALSKLSQSTINAAAFMKMNRQSIHEIIRLRTNQIITENSIQTQELSPPDSLSSAPPSYSYVLKQKAFRRRPRIVGTFIPSPSFIQQAPPPNYAAAFDIYLDNMPPPPTRVYNFGFAPMLIVCPNCGYTGMTVVTSKITLCTHLCALTLCVLCCWVCAPLPYVLRSCKDVSHYCRNCRSFLGMYCHTNPNAIS